MLLGKLYCDNIKVLEWNKECDFKLSKHFDIWRFYIPDHTETIVNEYGLLSDEEKSKSDTYVQKVDRDRYVLARIMLRKLIPKYLNINSEDVYFDFNEFKKPILQNNSGFNFNISHSGDYVIIGFANRWPVGVDIEKMMTTLDLYDLIFRCMSKTEISVILNSEFPRKVFYAFWTRKEALLKGSGVGLVDDLNEITCCNGVNYVPDKFSEFISTWKIRSFTIDDAYAVSIAHDSSVRSIRFYEM